MSGLDRSHELDSPGQCYIGLVCSLSSLAIPTTCGEQDWSARQQSDKHATLAQYWNLSYVTLAQYWNLSYVTLARYCNLGYVILAQYCNPSSLTPYYNLSYVTLA